MNRHRSVLCVPYGVPEPRAHLWSHRVDKLEENPGFGKADLILRSLGVPW